MRLGVPFRRRWGLAVLVSVAILSASFLQPTQALGAKREIQEPFRFERVISLDDMHNFVATEFPLGTARANLGRVFVHEGGARLVKHPTHAGVEKYLYDINLCDRYVWRWNISADYDSNGKLTQAYVNGEPVFSEGTGKRDGNALAKSGKAKIFKMRRPRPEALRGETELSYLLLDGDGDLRTVDDQVLTGVGPSRADAVNMGTMHSYANVDPWRSIFDSDVAQGIAPYSGGCG